MEPLPSARKTASPLAASHTPRRGAARSSPKPAAVHYAVCRKDIPSRRGAVSRIAADDTHARRIRPRRKILVSNTRLRLVGEGEVRLLVSSVEVHTLEERRCSRGANRDEVWMNGCSAEPRKAMKPRWSAAFLARLGKPPEANIIARLDSEHRKLAGAKWLHRLGEVVPSNGATRCHPSCTEASDSGSALMVNVHASSWVAGQSDRLRYRDTGR